MILRSLLWALALFLAYCFTVATIGPGIERRADYFFATHEEWEKVNIVRAQTFVSANLDGRDVYLGSSLTNSLNEAMLPRPFDILSLIGGGPLTGLMMLEESRQRPRRVFIETNYLLTRLPDTKLLDRLFAFPGGMLRRKIPAFRLVNIPTIFFLTKFFAEPLRPELSDAAWNERRQQLLAEPVGDDKTVIDPERVRKMKESYGPEFGLQAAQSGPLLEILQRTAHSLEARGVELIFYHMPMDADVMGIEAYQTKQNILAEHFPHDRYHWIQPALNVPYQTADGFHLTSPSGNSYTRHLLTQLSSTN
jgi:hypothetical protein